MSTLANAPKFPIYDSPEFPTYYDVWKGPDSDWVMGPTTKNPRLQISYQLDAFEYFETKEEAELALMYKKLGV